MANPRKFSEKIALHNQKQAEGTAEFEKVMREVLDVTNKSSLSNIEDLKHVQTGPMVTSYKERDRNTLGPMRPTRPAEKRADKSPYSGAYLSPPPDTSWRRTHSDSALHTSTHETAGPRREFFHGSSLFCLSSGTYSDVYRKGLDDYDISKKNLPTNDGCDGRPRSSSNLAPSSKSSFLSVFSSPQDAEGLQIQMVNNTGSLPDLTSLNFPPPLNIPLDQDDHGSPYNNNSQCGSPSSVSPTSVPPPCTSTTFYTSTPPHEAPGPPHYVNTGIGNQSFQQHYVFPQPLSPAQQPYSPQQQQQQSISYRSIKRPSPQTSPALTVQYTSRSSSPQSPASPCSIGVSSFDVGSYLNQTNALRRHLEQFTMADDSCQELAGDPGYFSTSPSQQLQYTGHQHPASTQTTPNTPSSIPDIVLTDFSNGDELAKDLGVAMAPPELFPTDECLREGLDPIDLDGLQMLTDPEIITDPATEDRFRLDRL